MKFNDAAIGIVLLLLAAGMIAYAQTFPAMPGQDYGSALFPTIIGAALAICGTALVAGGIRRLPAEGWFQPADWLRDPRMVVNFLSVPIGLLFYILCADTLGFMPTSVFLLSVILILLRRGKPVSSVAVAIVTTLIVHQVFSRLLLVPLPRGPLHALLF